MMEGGGGEVGRDLEVGQGDQLARADGHARGPASWPWAAMSVPATRRADAGAGGAQHPLGVIARRRAARSPSVSPSASSPASRTHDLTWALATGSLYSTPRSLRPSIRAAAGARRGSRARRPSAAAARRSGRPGGGGSNRRRRGRSSPPSWPASQPGRRRSSVPALPTSIVDPASEAPAAQADAADRDVDAARRSPTARRSDTRRPAPRPPRGSSGCRRRRGSPRSGSRPPPSRPGSPPGGRSTCRAAGAASRAAGPIGSKLRHRLVARADDAWPCGRGRAPRSAARSASSTARDPEGDGSVASSRSPGYSAMSSMLTRARPSASAISATVPGAILDPDPDLVQRPLAARRRRAARAARVAAPRGARPRRRSRSPARISREASLQALDRGVDLGRDRVAVGGEDVGPDRRVGAGHPGRVAEAGADLGQALGLLARVGGRLARRGRWRSRAAGG